MAKWLAGVALVLVAAAAFVLLRSEERSGAGQGAPEAPVGAARGQARGETSSTSTNGVSAAAAPQAAGEEAATEDGSRTPPLAKPATAADGFIELKVLRNGR